MEIFSQHPNTTSAEKQSDASELKLLVLGLNEEEKKFLSFMVRASRISRRPHIVHLDETHGQEADVVIIDYSDEYAKKWVSNNDWIHNKVVIGIDGEDAPGRTIIRRPIKWSYLPTMLARLQVQSKNMSVLVVDDSLAVRGQLRAMLEPRGLVVTDVENAEEAIKLAYASHYACILMDVLMPGIDGYEACRRIKEDPHFGRKANVVMLTSKSSPFDRIKGMMAGCDAYLTKPIDPDKLFTVISRYVEKPE